MVKTAAAMATLAAGAILFAPTANANQYGETQYLSALITHGITGPQEALLFEGYAACHAVQTGVPERDEKLHLMQTQNKFTLDNASLLLDMATLFLCPSADFCAGAQADEGHPMLQCIDTPLRP